MSLSSIIAEAVFENEHNGVVDRQAAINAALAKVKEDDELVDRILKAGISKQVKDYACKAVHQLEQTPAQHSLFGLRHAHTLDDDENIIKQTQYMTRIEFQGLITLRRRQVKADMAYLKLLEDAATETASIWDEHPDWTWGQVEAEYALRDVGRLSA
jgi:hypothetical protein